MADIDPYVPPTKMVIKPACFAFTVSWTAGDSESPTRRFALSAAGQELENGRGDKFEDAYKVNNFTVARMKQNQPKVIVASSHNIPDDPCQIEFRNSLLARGC